MTESTTTATPARLREVFDRQRATALRLRTSTAAERIARLKKLRDAVLAYKETWYAAGFADFHKSPGDIDMYEILPVIAEANDAIAHVASWMAPTRVWPTALMAGTRSHVKYEPRGRCLLISPWNYPVNLTFCPLVAAIAAGNTVIIKPSELTPNLSAAMAKMVREVFAEDEVAIFEGDASVAQGLLDLPFDHIFFTGSPMIGKVVMAAAAQHLASVTLELGGKSPTVVDATADLDLAAQTIMWAKYTNAGQTCIAPDHVYVHRSVKDAFVAKCKAQLDAAYGADPANSPDLTHIVNARHTARVQALLDDAVSRGAKVLIGGTVVEGQNVITPTLLENIPDDSRIMEEEIFGPLLPIFAYDALDDVIARINAAPKPLALYAFSQDDAAVAQLLAQTSSGGACVNHALVQYMHSRLPFGGVNNSGLGSANGRYGFLTFSHSRGVVETQLALAPKLFKAGRVPDKLRALINRLWSWV